MKRLLYLLPVLSLLWGCETDNDPVIPTNRYFKLVEVMQLPALNYDPDNSPPDLRIDLKRRSASFWEFSTQTENNAGSLPTFVVFPAEILATDEVYEIRIVDEDLNLPDDFEIFYWTFQAVDEGADGRIEFFDNENLIMALNYNVK